MKCPLKLEEIAQAPRAKNPGSNYFRLDTTSAVAAHCYECNFYHMDVFDLAPDICTCPSDLDHEEYKVLLGHYLTFAGNKSRNGFQKFVKLRLKQLRRNQQELHDISQDDTKELQAVGNS